MKHMTRNQKLGVIFIATLMLILGLTIDKTINMIFNATNHIEIEKSEKCEGTKLYYNTKEMDIYTHCVDSVKIKRDNGFDELSKLFETNTTVDGIIENMTKKEIYKDGGSTLYVDEINDVAILKCQTTDGNRDIYIGDKNMKYEETFCKNTYSKIDEENFEITYYVHDLINVKDSNKLYMTLKDLESDEYETVLVFKDDLKGIKKGSKYLFKFETDKYPFINNIKEVFAKSTIKEIEKVK